MKANVLYIYQNTSIFTVIFRVKPNIMILKILDRKPLRKTDDMMQATSAQTLRATRTYDREEFA